MTKRKSENTKPKKPGGREQGKRGGMGTENYTVLARKYRPWTFDDLIGQDAMVRTLRNAFATGRIAQAYMLTGVRGVGKTTTARIIARALNYTGKDGNDGPSFDINEIGEHCEAIMESRHVDVLEMDAASHTGVDNIREIIESARYKPVSARMKIYIIDEVHMLSKGAFNALLKTLEEPPDHVKFIFATTEVRKVPVTVLSRCQRFDLRRVESELLVNHFARIAELENVEVKNEALQLVARAAEGSVRDGLSILDQAIALADDGNVTAEHIRSMLGLADRSRIFDLLEKVFDGNASQALSHLSQLHQDGAEPGQILSDLAEAVHIVTRIKTIGEHKSDQSMSEEARKRALELSEKLSIPLLARAWQMLLKGLQEVNTAPQPLAAAEMVLVRMAYVSDLPSPDEIIRGQASQSQTKDAGSPRQDDRSATSEPLLFEGRANQDDGSGLARAVNSDHDGPMEPETVGLEESRVVAAGPLPELMCLEDVIALASEKRDAKLKFDLENFARLVNFRQGSIELNIVEGAPRNLINELGQKLTHWTGERWIVSISREPGEKTIAESRQEQLDAEIALVKEHPLVKDVLAHFPDAEITSVTKSVSDSSGEND